MEELQHIEIFNDVFAHRERFVRFAFSYLQDLSAAEDLVMDSFVYYWENRQRLDCKGNVPAYILTVVKHKCLDYLQLQKIHQDVYSQLQDDARYYSVLAGNVKKAFNKKFYNPETRSYGDFGSNIFALVLGVPDDRYDDVVATLKHEISVKYDNHLNTGIFGTQFFFETLALNGLNDIAYNAMNQEDFPSFGNWIKQGATVTWEKWNGADSRNHPMFGGGLTWFYRILAGVNVDAERPAYEHIIIKPILDKRLPEVYYSHMTPYGEVVSEIRQTGRNLEMNVTVPVGSTATIYIPVGGNTSEVTESGISVRDSKDVRFERIQDGNCIVRVPQGKYKFKVDNQ